MRHCQRERDGGGDRDRHVGGAAPSVEAAHAARDLPVGRQRVREPGEPEHLAVHRGEQHRRRGGPHQVATHVEDDPGLVRGDDGEHRRVDEAIAEGGVVVDHRRGHQCRNRHDDHEQQRRRDRGKHDPPQSAAADAYLPGEARGRLHADHGHGRDPGGEDQILPARGHPQVDRGRDGAGIPVLEETDQRDDREHGDAEQRQSQDAAEPVGRQAVDVLHGHEQERSRGDQEWQHSLSELAPEHREVLGDDDRAERHHDQVVQEDRPAGHEAPELVEGVAREAGGAATLDMERAALDVRGHRDREEDAGNEEDQRGQTERAPRHHAEREEDRGHDGAQRDREQRGLAEGASDQDTGPLGSSPQALGSPAEPLGPPPEALACAVRHVVGAVRSVVWRASGLVAAVARHR